MRNQNNLLINKFDLVLSSSADDIDETFINVRCSETNDEEQYERMLPCGNGSLPRTPPHRILQ